MGQFKSLLALSARQAHSRSPSVPKSGSGSNVSCFVGHEHAEHCSYPFGSGMGCHRMGRESRSPVHVTCQQRSSSQIATTGSLWPAMRTRTGVFTGAVQIGLHRCSPELGRCELVCGKATPSCSGRPAAWMIGWPEWHMLAGEWAIVGAMRIIHVREGTSGADYEVELELPKA